MPRGLLARLRDVFEGNPSIRKVANDPALTAELLLLLRMALADGQIAERELATLRRIAGEAFGIAEADLEAVMRHLEEFGYEISIQQAIDVFREFGRARRLDLARHLAEIAKADFELNPHEVRLLARVIEMLGITPAEVTARPSDV
jgi:uncharacterized tellurite resistance protein B-like protein